LIKITKKIWAAKDMDGEWWFYLVKPEKGDDAWDIRVSNYRCGLYKAPFPIADKNWEKSLMKIDLSIKEVK